MKFFVKHIISLILPVTALILVPLSIEPEIAVQSLSTLIIGFIFMIGGLSVLVWTISTFIRIGKGTLAPWSPTKKLVTGGIYGHVRNPMIMGVMTVLIGESLAISSVRILIWAILFFIINTLYFILYEEPDLERKFGEDYRHYKKSVSRWIPHWKPYVKHEIT
jgi:protein-S-isoprenylcysteine O-methyltransferase Ste14